MTARPLPDPESIFDEHIAALPNDVNVRLMVLIGEAVASSPAHGGRLADLDGLGRDIWEGVDPDVYVRELRHDWQGRP